MTDPIADFLARTEYASEPIPSPLNGYEAAAWMVRVRADLPEARRLLRDAQERIAALEAMLMRVGADTPARSTEVKQ